MFVATTSPSMLMVKSEKEGIETLETFLVTYLIVVLIALSHVAKAVDMHHEAHGSYDDEHHHTDGSQTEPDHEREKLTEFEPGEIEHGNCGIETFFHSFRKPAIAHVVGHLLQTVGRHCRDATGVEEISVGCPKAQYPQYTDHGSADGEGYLLFLFIPASPSTKKLRKGRRSIKNE